MCKFAQMFAHANNWTIKGSHTFARSSNLLSSSGQDDAESPFGFMFGFNAKMDLISPPAARPCSTRKFL